VSRILVIGDATLDVTVAASGPLRGGGDTPARIRFAPGGQGANVAVRLARREADVTLVAPVGKDASGRLLTEALHAEGVRLAPIDSDRSSTVVAMLDGAGERSMLSDRQQIPADAITPMLAAPAWIHLSAYALVDAGEGDALAAALGGRSLGAWLSIAGGSIPPDGEVAAGMRQRLAAARPELLVVNRDEAAALLGRQASTADTARALAQLAPVAVVTAAGQGSAASVSGTLVEVPAAPAAGPVVDATGSGDAYLASLVLELADGWPPSPLEMERAMARASESGARAARVHGAQGRIEGEAAAPGVPR